MVANPSGFDPTTRWRAAMGRRNVVLQKMLEQNYIDHATYDEGIAQTAPPVVQPPTDQTVVPDPTDPSRNLNVGYFNNWVRQQLVDRYGAQRAFRSGWRVRTTLDIDLQAAAERAVRTYLSNPDGRPPRWSSSTTTPARSARWSAAPTTSRGRSTSPRRASATGSAFKPFVLAAAIRQGISPGSTWSSRKKIFDVPGTHGKEKFVVNNYEGNYAGVQSLASATTYSDNSVYAEVGYKTGFRNIAHMARRMGIRTPVSTNPAITLGGLKQGVTVLDMAHAYETFAERGKRIEGTLGARGGGPVGIRMIRDHDGKKTIAENKTTEETVFTQPLADAVTPILQSVVSHGTGVKAQYGGFAAGKTGTTENYGDAWFVGYTEKYTIAVWVGYPDSVKSMKTDFGGSPVAGGTFPAEIWRAFVVQAQQIDQQRAADEAVKRGDSAPTVSTPVDPGAVVAPATGTTATPSAGTGGTSTAGGTGAAPQADQTAPAKPVQPPSGPPPSPATPPADSPGGTGGTSRAAAPPPPPATARPASGAPASRAARRATAATRCGCPSRRSATAARRPW